MKYALQWFKDGADEFRDACSGWEFRWMVVTIAAIFAIHKIGYALGL